MSTSTQTMIEPGEVEGVALRYHSGEPDQELEVITRRTGYVAAKAVGEWLIALLMVIGTAPLVLFLAAGVKLTSKGPAFYSQTRLGRNGRRYQIFKLRTMVHNAEAKSGPVWAAANDCRITRFGNLLRRTHLDELPQLWNVLRGEMGLIGPRPERPEIAMKIERKLPAYSERLKLRPGITGLAQMLVPADDPSDPLLRVSRKKLANDLLYVREVSFLLDVRIAISTACYFTAAAIDSVRSGLIKSYGALADRELG